MLVLTLRVYYFERRQLEVPYLRGRIVDWIDDRGFGFIEPESGGKRLFFHVSGTYGAARPVVGTEVFYELAKGPDGRVRAVSVAPIGVGPVRKHPSGIKRLPRERRQRRKWRWIAGVLFLAVLGWLVVIGKAPGVLLLIFALASFVTFIVYSLDKGAAERGKWRTPERGLQMLALFCGWPGALVAQDAVDHKHNKPSFQTEFWSMVVFNCTAIGCFLYWAGYATV